MAWFTNAVRDEGSAESARRVGVDERARDDDRPTTGLGAIALMGEGTTGFGTYAGGGARGTIAGRTEAPSDELPTGELMGCGCCAVPSCGELS